MAYAVTVPDTLEMIVGEKLNLTIDFTGVMGVGDVATTPIVTMVNEGANESVPSSIIGTPYFLGNVLNTTISSANLRPGSSYIASFTGSANNSLLSDGFETVGTTQTLFRSLGTDATGTLNAWTKVGAPTIAANVLTLHAPNDLVTAAHPDLGDCTFTCQFTFNGDLTGFSHQMRIHCNGSDFVRADLYQGVGLYISKAVLGVHTGNIAFCGFAALTNGAKYWLRLQSAGTNYTASIFADSANTVGALIGSCSVVITDASIQTGQVSLYSAGSNVITWGSANANVCTVTGPIPIGWLPFANNGEPAFCMSKINPFSGSFSLGIYNNDAGAVGTWQLAPPNVTPTYIVGSTYTLACQVKRTGLAAAYAQFTDTITTPAVANDGAWHLGSTTAATNASAYVQMVLSTGSGTAYFDNFALYQGTPVTIQLKIDVVY